MTSTDSRKLKTGSRVCWGGNTADSGKITETNWNAVTIAWDNNHVAVVHHGDMREIQLVR
jgi:Ser-tRNA(Ala) deacylase AlaX